MSNREKIRRRQLVRRQKLARRAKRRGVLLLVVLSMLVLFMLVGTAFLMTSNQSRTAAKDAAKQNRLGNLATRQLDRAMLDLLRDTENPYSVIRHHSLLGDVYGTNGFQGVIYNPGTRDLTTAEGQVARFAGAPVDTPAQQLGPTNGQFIDIYVSQKPYTAIDYSTLYNTTANPLDLLNVLKLDRNPYGQPQPYPLPLTKGYFNGCLLTVTSGAAVGQSTRILEYEYVGDSVKPTTPPTRFFRFRVMGFQNKDGQPLQVDQTTGAKGRMPELKDLTGQTFMVNGRAFSGTGVGYNQLATTGQPRLSALQLFQVDTKPNFIGAELALLPNSVYFNPLSTPVGAAPASSIGTDPFLTPLPADMFGKYTAGTYWPLNNILKQGTSTFLYPNYVGSGGANEGYDAADFQNIFMGLQTVTPRSQGRVVHSSTSGPVTLDVSDPAVLSATTDFLRLDLEDVPIPSFHRPDLVNFWNHRLLKWLTTKPTSPLKPDDAVRAIVQPYSDDKWTVNTAAAGLTAGDAALISAIKRQTMLRPTREDHPHFDGSNPMSVPSSLSASPLVVGGNIAIPTWEVVGQWDVDNDNDGVRDSVWVDLGDPIQETEDGRRYKALYAILCVDLDSRLNVNAHGLADDLMPPAGDSTKNKFFDPTYLTNGPWPGNLVHDAVNSPTTKTGVQSTLQLPRGLGYGPAEISLRSVFPAPLDASFNPIYGNRVEMSSGASFQPVDSYAALLRGRRTLDGKAISGRYGFHDPTDLTLPFPNGDAAAGTNYHFDTRIPKTEPATSQRWDTGELATPDLAAQMKFSDYPWSFWNAATGNTQRNYQSAFGTMPDLKGRYALGLDWAGQPVYEAAYDLNPDTALLQNPSKWLPFNLLAKSPYELDLSNQQRRDDWANNSNATFSNAPSAFNQSLVQNDDAPFSPTDLEKVLRGWDADHGTLPSRLWDVANEFDPVKLINYDPNRVQVAANAEFGSNSQPALLATAQEIAGISRRLVTTDSYSLPVANQTMPGYVSEFGADGAPGRRSDPSYSLGHTDDFQAVTGVSRAQGKLVDLLRYRVWVEARKYEMRRQGLTEAALDLPTMTGANYKKFIDAVDARSNAVFVANPQLISDLLAPEVIAGKRMDLNRPFGNGKDDNGDGVVDDPLEAGDPFLDINGNGKRDDGTGGTPVEPYIDLDGNGAYTPPGDQLWANLTANGTLGEPITFDYTNGHGEPLHTAVLKSLNTAVLGGVRNLDSQGRQFFARHLYCLMLLLTDDNYIAPWDENDPQLSAWMVAERTKLTSGNPIISAPEADMIVKRKLTCKMIAQWAVNCVDARDSDAIMTPFEYTENPWFGWGVWDDNWKNDPTNSNSGFANATFIPLDGDPATDENNAWIIDWASIPATGGPKVIKQIGVNPNQPVSTTNLATITQPLDQTRGVVWGAERPELLITETLAFHDRRTEDLSSNDRDGHGEMRHYTDGGYREPGTPGPNPYKDPDPDQGLQPRGSLFVEVHNPWSQQGQYPAEIYSRLDSTTTYLPKTQQGVDLSRLSNFAWDDQKGRLTLDATDATKGIKRSPVWRMIVVEEWPDSRNADDLDDNRPDKFDPNTVSNITGPQPYTFPAPTNSKEPQAYRDMATKVKNWTPTAAAPNPPFRPTDPDFDPLFGADMLQLPDAIGATRTYLVGAGYGTTGRVEKQIGTKNQFYVSYPSIEREFYFTTDKSPALTDLQRSTLLDQTPDYDYSPQKFRLRIPDRSVHIKYPPSGKQPKVGQTQKFIPSHLELASTTSPAIAPIPPGRYGVIGSAGANYNYDATNPNTPQSQIYTTTLGRLNRTTAPSGWNTDDTAHQPFQTRRIEMHPSIDPSKQQLVIASNGGDPNDEQQPTAVVNGMTITQFDPTTVEISRDNEMIYNRSKNKAENITTRDANGNAQYYQPCVAIPVEGMNISQPAWGYAAREREAAEEEAQIKTGDKSKATVFTFNTRPTPQDKDYEGRYYAGSGGTGGKTSYDKPFDGYLEHPISLELMRTGTTPNYRTIHLQRLANPLLPWNPEPKLANGEPNPEYRANMPMNPYRTVDSSSVNLTAFNGVSEVEANYGIAGHPNEQKELLQYRPWVIPEQEKYFDQTFIPGKQIWDLRSTERGEWSRLNIVGSAASPQTSPPQRVLWAQEPAMVKLKKDTYNIFSLIPGRQMSMRSGAPGDLREVPGNIMADQNIFDHRVNMVMEQTLGFGNKSFGLLYDAQGSQGPKTTPPVTSAVGAPAPGNFTWDSDAADTKVDNPPIPVNSTNPWLAWDNRPYVSAEELLKVPATSQSQMLRQYATIDVNAATRANPYGLASTPAQPDIPQTLGSPQAPAKNASRWAAMQAPFGCLANVFATTAVQPVGSTGPLLWYVQGVADVVRDSNGVPVLFDRKTGTTPPTNPNEADVRPYGAPNFSRILEYVEVPSRFVGTDTMLNAETFNDVPGVNDAKNVPGTAIGSDITDPTDPRYFFQPPFNKVSRERDPGRVNLNTVTGRRIPPTSTAAAQIWSEVFDGIMHRFHDGNVTSQNQLGHFGPAWRDVVLSRRGYAQVDAAVNSVDKPPIATNPKQFPDTFEMGLNSNFPTVFANPFRSPDAGDLVPVAQMMQYGVDASMLRVHPYGRSADKKWGDATVPLFGDARDAGFGDDALSIRNPFVIPGTPPTVIPTWTIPSDDVAKRDSMPLFSESRDQSFADTDRNPYMMYEPMSRLGNLVTNRSGVYAVWITVGYFEVETAPTADLTKPTDWGNKPLYDHFGGDINLYNRAYPDGYMLGKELGSETGDVKRPRGFYIIDRTEEVGFKPGEDLNVEKTIRLRRRIE
jgi:hypothetical protein